MLRRGPVAAGIIAILSLTPLACATRTANPAPVVAAPVVPVERPRLAPVEAPQLAKPDLVADLIAVSTSHFEKGRSELQLGHLDAARSEFNRAVEVLLESPLGGRSNPAIREHFDSLVQRISAVEITALAQGDGFAEKGSEPAQIDEILAQSTFEVTPSEETTRTVSADLETTVHDIEIPLNARVLSFVQLFSGRLKGFLEEGLSNSVRYLPMIQDIFRAEGLPLDLAYVPLIESAFKPSAVSRARARGIWQFMAPTGLEYGLRTDWYIDERSEPEKATRAAARYLKVLHKMFDGDWHLALASYNGGPGRVQRAMRRAGRDDFWQLTASTRFLPRETRDYVPLILAAIIVARNPAQYGMNITPIDPVPFERVTLPAAVDLRRVAEWANVAVQTIQELNPELRRWTTPIRSTDYELKVPAGTAETIRTELARANAADLAPLNWHTVKRGETLASIARTLKVSRADLAEANYLRTQSRLTAGQRLIIPRAPTLLLAARPDTPTPAVGSSGPDTVVAAGLTQQEPEPAPQEKVVYRVKRGDTLYSIARVYDTTVEAIKSWNGLRSNAIQVGQRLTIVRGGTVTATS